VRRAASVASLGDLPGISPPQAAVTPPEDIDFQINKAVEAIKSASPGSNAYVDALRTVRELLTNCRCLFNFEMVEIKHPHLALF
jgi:hypothetical protein